MTGQGRIHLDLPKWNLLEAQVSKCSPLRRGMEHRQTCPFSTQDAWKEKESSSWPLSEAVGTASFVVTTKVPQSRGDIGWQKKALQGSEDRPTAFAVVLFIGCHPMLTPPGGLPEVAVSLTGSRKVRAVHADNPSRKPPTLSGAPSPFSCPCSFWSLARRDFGTDFLTSPLNGKHAWVLCSQWSEWQKGCWRFLPGSLQCLQGSFLLLENPL